MKCSICTSDHQEALEVGGREAMLGSLSWRQAAQRYEVRPEALRNHMERHVVVPEIAAAEQALSDELDELIQQSKDELMEQFHLAPADVKPLVLVALQNLDGLRRVKPSQETLIKALKTIQEMTGMKTEQRLMLQYADAKYKRRQVIDVRESKELTP